MAGMKFLYFYMNVVCFRPDLSPGDPELVMCQIFFRLDAYRKKHDSRE